MPPFFESLQPFQTLLAMGGVLRPPIKEVGAWHGGWQGIIGDIGVFGDPRQ
jgi:hypothetical protein